ncbi:hypothetical protein M5D96_008657 [Drosophila gunungcola]|uniref:Transmembrane protein n=1 Tax=Drosophila gunungcola TaxID=103775 RepID=A0A9Q0BP81_9MUSC|nr:hypothetical protein M5D96_008657 [Drosophila gunungcola]
MWKEQEFEQELVDVDVDDDVERTDRRTVATWRRSSNMLLAVHNAWVMTMVMMMMMMMIMMMMKPKTGTSKYNYTANKKTDSCFN